MNGIKIYNRKEIKDSFCSNFSNVERNIADNLGTSPHHFTEYMTTYANTSDFLYPNDKHEIEKIIASLKNTPPCGNNGLSNKFIRQIKNEISSPFATIFNTSLSEGKFPDKLKV